MQRLLVYSQIPKEGLIGSLVLVRQYGFDLDFILAKVVRVCCHDLVFKCGSSWIEHYEAWQFFAVAQSRYITDRQYAIGFVFEAIEDNDLCLRKMHCIFYWHWPWVSFPKQALNVHSEVSLLYIAKYVTNCISQLIYPVEWSILCLDGHSL